MEEKFYGLAIIFTGICIITFILSSMFPGIFNQFILVSNQVQDRPWTVITHMFLHADFRHLYFNMFALAIFGSILEKYIGSRNFLFVFFSTGIVSSIADVMFYSATLGASGAVFGLLGCLTIIRPKQLVWALGVPMYIIAAAVIWILLDLAGLFYPDNIAHAAHLFGMGFGMVIGAFLRDKYKDVNIGKNKRDQKDDDQVITDKELEEWEKEYMMK